MCTYIAALATRIVLRLSMLGKQLFATRELGLNFSVGGLVYFQSQDWFVTIQPQSPSRDFCQARFAFDRHFGTTTRIYDSVVIDRNQKGIRLSESNAHRVKIEWYFDFLRVLNVLAVPAPVSRPDLCAESVALGAALAGTDSVQHALKLLQQPFGLAHGDLVIGNTILRDTTIIPIDFEVGVSGASPIWHDSFLFVCSLPPAVRIEILSRFDVVGFQRTYPYRPHPSYALAECILFADQVRRRRNAVQAAYIRHVAGRRLKRLLN